MSTEATELDETESEELSTDSTEAPEEVQLEADSGDEPLEEVTSESTDSNGQPRDPKGRFAPKGQADTAEAELTAPESPDLQPEVVQTFTFKSDKQEYTIEGATYVPGKGLTVPDDQIPQVKQLLSEGAYFRTNWKNLESGYKRQIDELKARPSVMPQEVEQAKALLAQLDRVLSDPDAAVEFIANLEIQGPVLRERARAQLLESKLKEYESRGQSEKQQQESEQLENDKIEAWTGTFDALKADKAFSVFKPEDWQAFDEEMREFAGALFVEQEDGLYLNEAAIIKAARQRAEILKRGQQTASTVAKAVEFNARRQVNKAPPAPVGASRSGTPVVAAPEAPPKNWEEWKKRQGLNY